MTHNSFIQLTGKNSSALRELTSLSPTILVSASSWSIVMYPCCIGLMRSFHVGMVSQREVESQDVGLRTNDNNRPDRTGDSNGNNGQGNDSGNNSPGNGSRKLILCERLFDREDHWILSLLFLLWTGIGCSLLMIRLFVIIWYRSYNYSKIEYLFPLCMPWPHFMRTIACRLLVLPAR